MKKHILCFSLVSTFLFASEQNIKVSNEDLLIKLINSESKKETSPREDAEISNMQDDKVLPIVFKALGFSKIGNIKTALIKVDESYSKYYSIDENIKNSDVILKDITNEYIIVKYNNKKVKIKYENFLEKEKLEVLK